MHSQQETEGANILPVWMENFPSGIHPDLFLSTHKETKDKTDLIVLSVNSRQ